MILDIVSIFLDLLPELILGAGPLCVFKGMGTGKDSGKLLFKKINFKLYILYIDKD